MQRHTHKNGGSSFHTSVTEGGGCEYFGFGLTAGRQLHHAASFANFTRGCAYYEFHEGGYQGHTWPTAAPCAFHAVHC